jgi:hypothetical protein
MMTDDGRQGAGSDGEAAESPADDPESDPETAHLSGVADGCGCAEVWEHLSEQRETERER